MYSVSPKPLICLMLKQVKIFVSATRSDVALARKKGQIAQQREYQEFPVQENISRCRQDFNSYIKRNA